MQVFRKAQNDVNTVIAREISEKFNLPIQLSEMLCARGIDDVKKAQDFLYPNDELFHDPFLFAQMQDAVDCICATGEMGAKICIYGDYDCDGISAVAILYRYLESLDYDVIPYIPERHEDGYGLNVNAIDELNSLGVELIITVDCGITAVKEVEYAYMLGMEVVITDHHQCPEILPECEAIINPSNNDGYPFSMLCGAGVAFKVVQAIGGLQDALKYIDIAAVATVADIVELRGENRLIVIRGLEKINSGDCIAGIRALVDVCGLEIGKLATDNISFGLAPRINAMGRVGSAMESLRLFLSDEDEEALALSRKLDSENSNRQEIERGISLEIEKKISSRELDISNSPIIISQSDDWNLGVIGIVCSKLTYKYNKPVLLFSGDGDQYTASGRSIKGINLYEELLPYSDMFERFGGHKMAAGITIKKSKYDEFKSALLESMKKNIDPEAYLPVHYYDLELSVEEINKNTVTQIERISPFGTGNTAPNILIKENQVDLIKRVGADKSHLQFKIGAISFISFGTGDSVGVLRSGNSEIICNIEKNFFAGTERLQGKVVAFKEKFPIDIDNYISKREYKFTSAFLNRIIYNSDAYKDHSNLSYENRKQLKQQIKINLQKSVFGTLILVENPKGAKELLNFIKEEEFSQKVEMAFGGLDSANAYNAIVFAPNLKKLDFSRYESVIGWDGVYDGAMLRALNLSNASRVMLNSQSDASWIKNIPFTREELIPIYKIMINISLSKQSFAYKDEYIDLICETGGVERKLVEYALRCFDELGFIDVIDTVPFVVKVNNNPKTKELTQSSWHSKALGAYDEHIEWSKNDAS